MSDGAYIIYEEHRFEPTLNKIEVERKIDDIIGSFHRYSAKEYKTYLKSINTILRDYKRLLENNGTSVFLDQIDNLCELVSCIEFYMMAHQAEAEMEKSQNKVAEGKKSWKKLLEKVGKKDGKSSR